MKKKKVIWRVFLYVAVFIVVLWTIAPLTWMFISSIVEGKEMLVSDSIIPKSFTFNRYKLLLFNTRFSTFDANIAKQSEVFRNALINSIIVGSATVIISLLFGSLAAYAIARLRFKGGRVMLFSVLFFQLLPPIALVIPYYLMASSAYMLDKLITLIIIDCNFILAYVVWMQNGYFKSIPSELEDAARIDGCTWFSTFFRIIFPITKPGFVAVGALSFLMSWDEFMYALVFTQSTAAKTIPVAVSEFGTRFGVDYGMMMTAGVVATIIPMMLALFFQKYIVSGLTAGAVKE
jgi:multiple sugar transport system permease protein